MTYFSSAESFSKFIGNLLAGTGVTLEIFIFTLILSIPLGFVLCFGRMSKLKPICWLSKLYILIFRGTPLMLQVLFFWFGDSLLKTGLDRISVAIFAYALNYAADFAEIFRGGIQAIPRGQYEAADMLGLTRKQSFYKIVLPQVCKNVLPPVGNEVITLVKDTALVSIIAVSDLIREAQIMVTRDSNLIPFVAAAIFYLILTSIFTWVFNRIEKRMSYYKV